MPCYLLLAYDPIAVWGLVVAIVGVVVGVVAAVAAIYAAVYAKAAPTRDDLSRVEENTAHLEEVRAGIVSLAAESKRQAEADALTHLANRISITVRGEGDAEKSLSIFLTGTEPNHHFTWVQFRSEVGNVFGKSECIATGKLFEYIARVPVSILANWRNSGTGMTPNTTRHVLRVWVRFDEHSREVYRDMAVTLSSAVRGGSKDAPGVNVAIFRIEGAV